MIKITICLGGWLSILTGVFVVVVAWQARVVVRCVHIRTPEITTDIEINPSESAIAVWFTRENDILQIGDPSVRTRIFSSKYVDILTQTSSRSEEDEGERSLISDASIYWKRAHFGFLHGLRSGPPTPSSTVLWVPTWAAVLMLFIAAFYMLRGQKRRPGSCRVCGYDIRASPEQCPECGAKLGTIKQ